jgi:BCD family chlorophyll transporter-like MFS transporter
VPYLWSGTLLQFCGLSFMPFAVLALSGQEHGPAWIGQLGAAVAFLLVGAGMQIAQTAGLALATDLAPERTRPRVVALMYVMLLVGMVGSGLVFSVLLQDFTPLRLIQVVQGAAAFTLVVNGIALWKQEKVQPMTKEQMEAVRPIFHEGWRDLMAGGTAGRLLLVVMLGTMGFHVVSTTLTLCGNLSNFKFVKFELVEFSCRTFL